MPVRGFGRQVLELEKLPFPLLIELLVPQIVTECLQIRMEDNETLCAVHDDGIAVRHLARDSLQSDDRGNLQGSGDDGGMGSPSTQVGDEPYTFSLSIWRMSAGERS